jgi:hypothetical protein
LYFIADLLFATDIWIKTGLKLQPCKDHSDKGATMGAAGSVICSNNIVLIPTAPNFITF